MSKSEQKEAYRGAPEVQEIADNLIKTIPEHNHLAFCKVVYLFNQKVQKVRGAEALATASKVTGRTAFFLWEGVDTAEFVEPTATFVISVWESGWHELSDSQKIALVDHELCHCKIIDDGDEGSERLVIKPHDIEEFHSVVYRHGQWRPDIASFVRDAQAGQKRLKLDETGS